MASSRAYIDESGIHIPEYADILADLHAEFRAIYGQDLYLEPDSQDGAMLAVFALRLYDSFQLAADVYNSYSPATAQGEGLSSVVKTNGIARDRASRSSVPLRLTGRPGTSIPQGMAEDDAGQRWLLPPTVIIPETGETTVVAEAENIGDVRAAAARWSKAEI
jgi:uncharacterized phage protein gp47/JayE